jgi:hypothetical protein
MIGMVFVPTLLTNESVSDPVVFFNMLTKVASLGGIPWVNKKNTYIVFLRPLHNELLELIKRPGVNSTITSGGFPARVSDVS